MPQTVKKNRFYEICLINGLNLSDHQKEQIDLYVNLLLEWNAKLNLISRKDEENIWTYHILHSISPLLKLEIALACSMIDIGTGGGLPGVPLKILRPDIKMLCLDSTGKKVKAVENMLKDLNLDDIKVVWGRAEEIGLRKEYKGKFDFALARGVAPLGDLVQWSRGFLKNKIQSEKPVSQITAGRINPKPPVLLAFKGGEMSAEMESAKRQHNGLEIESIDLRVSGAEDLISSDKKLLIVHLKSQL